MVLQTSSEVSELLGFGKREMVFFADQIAFHSANVALKMAILLLPKLAAIARGRFSDKNLADEALQEFWIKIINKADSFKHDSKVSTWAYQVVNNTYLDLIRRESKRSYLNEELSTVESRADQTLFAGEYPKRGLFLHS